MRPKARSVGHGGEARVVLALRASSLPVCVLEVQPVATGVSVTLCPDKAAKWAAELEEAIESEVLQSGAASKLAGKLQWANQHLFYRYGRAMVAVMHRHKRKRCSMVDAELRRALLWWRAVLNARLCELRPWNSIYTKPCRLFVDAAGMPARCAAVLWSAGNWDYTDGAPPAEIVASFRSRGDNQIMSLEVLAILLALTTFAAEVSGRRVVLYSDNCGAQHATARGSARSSDHNAMVHEIWEFAYQHQMLLWIERVPSERNISDSPSRFHYEEMVEIGAKWREPCFVLGAAASAA